MARWLTISAVLSAAALFGWGVPLLRLFDAFQPMMTGLSIMVAAVFVRLNRGMPTLEWKSADPEDRKRLTTQIVKVTKEYGWIIAINACALAGFVALTVVGKLHVQATWPEWAQRLTAGTIGATLMLCVSRMAYVVWRDIDVVVLRKRLIDGTASRDGLEREAKIADDKVAIIRSAGLRRVEVAGPKAWAE